MISLHDIARHFGDVRALDGVTFDIHPGEIHALLGENGAGKTTLMRVLYGLLPPDRGEIRAGNRPVRIRRPEDARRLGIGMVHQHFMLVERLTVADNVLLGDRRGGMWQSPATRRQRVADLARRTGIDIDPGATVESLAVGQRQRVELLKAMRETVTTLILDEPTAVLTPRETEVLFATLRGLRERGCGIVFISHKLAEVMRLCDRITVLRRGQTIWTGGANETSADPLASLMTGAAPGATGGLPARADRGTRAPPPGRDEVGGANAGELESAPSTTARASSSTFASQPLLTLRNITTEGLSDVSLQIRPGEIVGIAGVEGNGQSALVEVALGLRDLARGERIVRTFRIAHIADDRHREALALPMTVAENMILKRHAAAPFSSRGVLNRRAIRDHARDLARRFDVRCGSVSASVSTLSGGNQQKLILGRELDPAPELIIAVNPARGLDIAATADTLRRLRAARVGGAGVLLISSDLDELAALADRCGVLYRGRLHDAGPCPLDMPRIAALIAGAAA
jgi:simple sugar transport system ATP-binding protein